MSTIFAINKRATFDYDLLEEFEGGLMLTGAEVKSVKNGHAQLSAAFLTIRNNALWLKNAHISAYPPAGAQPNYDPDRDRKVLVHLRELKRLIGKKQTQGLTLVPLRIYLKGRMIKLAFAVAKGKKKYEKREAIKKRETDRMMREKMKQ